MEEITRNNSLSESSCDRCSYCGAALCSAFYFCHVCATPYKPIEAITGQNRQMPKVESELIREKAPHVWPVFWTYACLIFVVSMIHTLLDEQPDAKLYTLLTGSVLMLLVTTFFEIIYWRSLVSQLKRFGFFSRYAWYAVLLLPCLLLFNYMYHFVFIANFVEVRSFNDLFKEMHLGLPSELTLFCILPAITEEVAFRGLIQHWLTTVIRPWRAIVLGAALFAAIHLSVVSAPYLFLMGLLLGWSKWKTGSLYPAMVIHFLHNAVVLFVFPYLVGG